MPNNGTKIYVDTSVTPHLGIDIRGDISHVVRGSDNIGDLGQLCKDVDGNGVAFNPPKINIWSKVKPTEVAGKPGILTESDYYGTASDHSANIYWGIQVYVPDTVNITNIHNCTWTWAKRPTTWFRIMDFNGYDHAAVPNPAGSIPDYAFINTKPSAGGKMDGLYAYYVPNNTTGVDLSAALFDQQSLDLTNVYPCILVDGYYTALTNLDAGVPRPLKYNNAYPGGVLYADLTKPLYGGSTPPPFASTDGTPTTRQVSLFLMRLYNGTLLVPGTNEDMANYWFQASSGIVAASKAAPVPGCTGKSVIFKYVRAGVDVGTNVMFYSQSNFSFPSRIFDASNASQNSYTVTVEVGIATGSTPPSTTTNMKTTTASKLNDVWIVGTPQFSWNEFSGLVPYQGMVFSVRVRFTCGDYVETYTFSGVTYSTGGGTVNPD
jgi:hypothetical protein